MSSLKYGVVEKSDGSCIKRLHSGVFTFGVNTTEEQVSLSFSFKGIPLFAFLQQSKMTYFINYFSHENNILEQIAKSCSNNPDWFSPINDYLVIVIE